MISPTAEYALRAVVAIAFEEGESATTLAIARLTKVPSGYLPKVLQMLGKAGLVESRRGAGGGFKLAKSPDRMSVLEVVNAVDPIKRIKECPLELELHGTELCPLHRRLDEATAHIESTFAKTTIAELLRQPGLSTPFCNETQCNSSNLMHIGLKPNLSVKTKVSRRNEALIEWSRDHSLGLAVAKHLIDSFHKSSEDMRSALQEFISAWRGELSAHFTQEEQILLPRIISEAHVMRLQKEHSAIRANAELAQEFLDKDEVDSTWLRGVGTILRDHIRWEERELFPYIEESLSKADLQRIADEVERNRSNG